MEDFVGNFLGFWRFPNALHWIHSIRMLSSHVWYLSW